MALILGGKICARTFQSIRMVFALLSYVLELNTELSFGHKALHGIASGFICELLRTKRERRSVRTAKCKIWGKSLRSHWTIAVVNFFARKTEENSHQGIHRHSKWFDDKTEL